jgi:hypothetical protein
VFASDAWLAFAGQPAAVDGRDASAYLGVVSSLVECTKPVDIFYLPGPAWQWQRVAGYPCARVFAYADFDLWTFIVVGCGGLVASQTVQLAAHGGLLCRSVWRVGNSLAGGGSSLPHWTAPAWVALASLAGVGLAQTMQDGRRWLVACLVFAQAMCYWHA